MTLVTSTEATKQLAKIITLACQKGGSGKTSNAVNIAYELTLRGYRVLLIDTDASRDCTIAIGFRDMEGTYNTLYNLYSEDSRDSGISIHDIIYPTAYQNLHIIPSSDAVSWVEKVATMRSQGDYILSEILEPLRNEYDFIIIDTPPTLSKTLDSALIASDSVLIPIQAQYLASVGAANLIKTIRLIQKRANKNLQIAGAFANMYDIRNNMSNNTLQIIKKIYDRSLQNVIRNRVEISYAQEEGKPVQAMFPKGDATQDYRDLVSEVLEINDYTD